MPGRRLAVAGPAPPPSNAAIVGMFVRAFVRSFVRACVRPFVRSCVSVCLAGGRALELGLLTTTNPSICYSIDLLIRSNDD